MHTPEKPKRSKAVKASKAGAVILGGVVFGVPGLLLGLVALTFAFPPAPTPLGPTVLVAVLLTVVPVAFGVIVGRLAWSDWSSDPPPNDPPISN